MMSRVLPVALGLAALVALCTRSSTHSLQASPVMRATYNMGGIRGLHMATRRPRSGCKAVSDQALQEYHNSKAQAPLDAKLYKGKLPYDAKKLGFTQAIERATRNRDLAAMRLLEQARSEVMQLTANGGIMAEYDEIRRVAKLNRRKGMMEASARRRQKEDDLVKELKAQGRLDLDDKDEHGLTIDVRKVIALATGTIEESLKSKSTGPRLMSLKMDVDPMPWWDAVNTFTLQSRICQDVKKAMDYKKVVVLVEDPSQMANEPTEGLIVGRLGDESVDLDGADLIMSFAPELDTIERMDRMMAASKRTANGDVVVIAGQYGAPSDPVAKQVRQYCKDHFSGGLEAISFVMDPVKLVPEVGGDPYPLPQWLIDAGYKAAGNVAVTGNSGTGKSSLNNAMRGLNPRDDRAAAVGVKETTIDPHGYDFEIAGDEMRLWDLPGAGTPKFPLKSYMRTMGIKYFDEIVIASAQRFTETDLALMDELRMHGIPFIALRTKVDLEIRNAETDTGATAEETLTGIRNDIALNSLLPEERIFMVSSRRPEEFDFPRLKQYIIDSLNRAVEVKLAKAMNRKLEIFKIYNAVI